MSQSKSNQLQSVTPLDHLFDRVTLLLKSAGDSNVSTVENLFTAIQAETEVVKREDDTKVISTHREIVVDHLLTLLESIQNESHRLQTTDPNMITISLHDMKVFHALFNRIVIDGIYPCLTRGVGIPLRKRQRQSQRQKQHSTSEPTMSIQDAHRLLQIIVDRLLALLNQGGDIPDLILRGGYFNDIISATLELAYHPQMSSNTITDQAKKSYQKAADQLIERVDTYSLFMYLTSMIQPDSPPWFISVITRWLARLTVDRPEDGVRSLIEFVSGSRHNDTISLEVLTRAVQVLKSVPRGFDPQRYAVVIGRQLMDILALAQPNSVLATATAHIIFTLFEQRPDLIKRGLIDQIKALMDPPATTTVPLNETLITESDLTIALAATTTLVKSGSNPQLVTALMDPIVKSLWLLLGYLCDSKKPLASTMSLFTTYMIIQSDKLETIVDIVTANFFFAGQDTWSFKNGPNGGVEIRRTGIAELEVLGPHIFDKLDQRLDLFFQMVENFKASGKTDLIGRLFLHIVKRWFAQRELSMDSVHHDDISADPFAVLIDLRLLETFIEKYKAIIVKSPSEIYRIVFTVLQDYVDKLSSSTSTDSNRVNYSNIRSSSFSTDADSDDEDSDDEDEDAEQTETVSMCLSLLTALVSEAEQSIDVADQKLLSSAAPLLKYIADHTIGSLSTRTTMCSQLLTQILAGETPGENEDTSKIDSNASSRKILQEALAGLDDPLVPVRAHSLTTIRTLVQNRDPLLDMTTALNVFLAQLKDEDSFIYLNAIKGLEALADINGPAVLPLLLNQYISPLVELDERLKVGEVLLRAEQRLGEALVGPAAELIAEYMVSIIRRRPAVGKNEEDSDDRLRMSAMSILGMACELSPSGIGRWLDMAIECAVGILTMERTDDKAIMRRSAVVLLGSLLKGIEDINQFPQAQINAMADKIKYIEATDNDNLVRHQASDVLDLMRQIIHNNISI